MLKSARVQNWVLWKMSWRNLFLNTSSMLLLKQKLAIHLGTPNPAPVNRLDQRNTFPVEINDINQWGWSQIWNWCSRAGPPIEDDEDCSEQDYSLWSPPSDLWERKCKKSAGAHECASGGQPLRETRMMITGWKG